MTEISQKNLRYLLPGKIAKVVSLMTSENKTSLKEALLSFYASPFIKILKTNQQNAGGSATCSFLLIQKDFFN